LQHQDSVAALLHRAQSLHQAGNLSAAEAFYRQVLEQVPNHPETLYLLGTALLQLGQTGEAVDRLERAARALRNQPRVLGNLARAYFGLGRYAEAKDAFQKAARLDPRNVSFQVGAAGAGAMQGELAQAETALRRLADRFPGSALVWLNLGNVLRDQKRPNDALACYAKALEIEPRLAEAHNNLGSVLHALYRFEEAERAYRAAIASDPGDPSPAYNLASLLIDAGRFREAEEVCREIIREDPQTVIAHTFCGAALGHQGRIREALQCHRRALEIAPQNFQIVENYATALVDAGDFQEALKWFSRAFASKPDAMASHQVLAGALLAQGRLADGWRGYAFRPGVARFCEQHAEIALSRSLPSELEGKHILLLREQGLGDEIFFLRYAPSLAAAGARITYRGSSKIRTLLARAGCLAEVLEESAPTPPADAVMLVGDLPHALSDYPASALQAHRADAGDLPVAALASRIALFWPVVPPTLRFAPLASCLSTIERRLAESGAPPYFGVTWRAGTPSREQRGNAAWSLQKEIDQHALGHALRDLPGTFLVLQRNPELKEIERLARALGRPLHDYSDLNEDLESMHALLALIDEYIGVSNTNTHLRAAAGRTGRVLVPRPAEWRWMAAGATSPWFPGFSVYRQSLDGDWSAALEQLREDLLRGC
jgi:tetratricopeptide (TPR) repeat protein